MSNTDRMLEFERAKLRLAWINVEDAFYERDEHIAKAEKVLKDVAFHLSIAMRRGAEAVRVAPIPRKSIVDRDSLCSGHPVALAFLQRLASLTGVPLSEPIYLPALGEGALTELFANDRNTILGHKSDGAQ